MMKIILAICFSIVLLQIAVTEDPCVIGNGKYLKENKEFDIYKFFGTYYVLYLFRKDFISQHGCWIDNYFVSGHDTVHTTEAYNVSSKKRIQFYGNVTFQGRYMYKEFPTWTDLTTNFTVIANCPEYQFAIFGGCPNATDHKPLIWIGFRNPNPPEKEVDAAKMMLKDNGLDFADFGKACEDEAQYSFN
ncbi:hypothetical protein C0J52_10023 [Blattella germanica]|nr:hypothetical protein C0J52_10023 [Blattella germanica]